VVISVVEVDSSSRSVRALDSLDVFPHRKDGLVGDDIGIVRHEGNRAGHRAIHCRLRVIDPLEPGLRSHGALARGFRLEQKALVFDAFDLHVLDDVGEGRETREHRDKARRHIEPHVDQQGRAEAQGQHADQREQLLAAPGNGISGKLPDKSSPHRRFSIVAGRAARLSSDIR